MNNWDRVERLLGAEILAQLRQKKVAIIGLGSGGGFVGVSLAMSGVSQFILMDDDLLEGVNVVRHVGDLRDVGRAKVEVVRDLILQRNPQAEVTTIMGRLEHHQEALQGIDLLISGVDGENTKFQLNEICLALNIPAVYAGVYERGEGGDVVLIEPYEGACYACWAANLRDGYISPSPDGSGELDYGLIKDGVLEAEPALWLHVVRVAATQADIALNRLLKNTSAYRPAPANTVVLANQALEIITGRMTPPYSAEWVNIAADPDCLICGHRVARLTNQQEHSLDSLGVDGLMFEEDAEAPKGRLS